MLDKRRPTQHTCGSKTDALLPVPPLGQPGCFDHGAAQQLQLALGASLIKQLDISNWIKAMKKKAGPKKKAKTKHAAPIKAEELS